MHVEPQAARFHVETTPEGLRASIPARRRWPALLFMCAWLTAWFCGEISAIRTLAHQPNIGADLFMVVWLMGWTVGGAFVLGNIVWQFAGREVIAIDAASLVHRIEGLGLARVRSYRLADVRHLRASPVLSVRQRPWMPSLIGDGQGPLAFDYGARTIRLAPSLDEAEARMLAAALAPRLPRRLDEPADAAPR